MYFHPRDTVDIYQSLSQRTLDHLWYGVHYFQQKSYCSDDSKNRLHPLQEQLKLSPQQRDTINGVQRRRYEALALLSQQYGVQIWHAEPIGAFVHGMGAAHVRETSLTLHPVYGIPYIPGSSVKGAVKHWALQSFFRGDEQQYEDALLSEQEEGYVARVIHDIFGSQEIAGSIQFHDAFVSESTVLTPDILTVHYKDYYEGNQSPTDDMSPIPHAFYVVEASYVEFVIVHSGEPKQRRSRLSDDDLLEVAGTWLQLALSETGIGSKTTSGYGYFSSFKDRTEDILGNILNRIKKEEASRREREEEKKRNIEKRKREEALAKKLANMSQGEKLAYEIEQLTDNEEDKRKSKFELYNEAVKLAEQGDVTPLKALRAYWERIGDWHVKKRQKRQFEKVQKLKQLLGE